MKLFGGRKAGRESQKPRNQRPGKPGPAPLAAARPAPAVERRRAEADRKAAPARPEVTGPADALLMGYVRLPLESNEMLLYPNPDQAPPVHPGVALEKPAPVRQTRLRQLRLWDETDIEVRQDDK